jgi:WD40 repeat protein
MTEEAGYDVFISYGRQQDRELGPALQAKLQGFAKPWYKLRALRVYCDTANLAANPALWTELQGALKSSEWLVLLASPGAAGSKWVNREVAWWLENRPLDRLLVAGTAPGLAWDDEASGWAAGAPVPPALLSAFPAEPFYVDLSSVTYDGQVPLLSDNQLAAIAAPVRGVPMDTLIGEHLREHRRAVRWARMAVTALVTLTVAAVVAGLVAISQRNTALSNEAAAQSEAMAAEAARLVTVDSPLAMLVGLQAYERAPTLQARSALVEATQPPLEQLLNISGTVNSVAFSPDGRTLAAGDGNGNVYLRPATGSGKTVTLDEGSPVYAVAFSPDGDTLAVAGKGGLIGLWDLAATQPTRTSLKWGGTSVVKSLAFSRHGSFLAAGDSGDEIGVWTDRTDTGVWHAGNLHPVPVPVAMTGTAIGPVNGLAFSPDGRTLAAGGYGERVYLWKPASGSKAVTMARAGSRVLSVAFSPDGHTLAAGDIGGDVSVWDLAVNGMPKTTLAEGSTVNSVAFSPDGQTLAAGDIADDVGLWDLATKSRTATLAEGSRVNSVAFSAHGGLLAAGDDSGDAGLWDPSAAQQANFTTGHPVNAVAFSPAGETLAAGDINGNLRLWDTANGSVSWSRTYTQAIYTVAFSPSGGTLAVGDLNGYVYAYGWDAKTKHWNQAASPLNLNPHHGPHDVANSVALSPNGNVVAVGDSSHKVHLWYLATGAETVLPLSINGPVNSVAFSPKGNTVAAGASNDYVYLASLGGDMKPATLKINSTVKGSTVKSVAFDQDGGTLAAGDSSGQVRLWNTATKDQVVAFTENGPISSIAFSAQGSFLATGDLLGNVDFWNTGNGQEVAALPEADGGVTGLSFSASGQVLAIGGNNGNTLLLRPNLTNLTRASLTRLICGKIPANPSNAPAEYAQDESYQDTCP